MEHGLHDRRDRTFQEDQSQLRIGHAPHLLAILNNIAPGLIARQGETHRPQAQGTFADQFDRGLARLAGSRETKHVATALTRPPACFDISDRIRYHQSMQQEQRNSQA